MATRHFEASILAHLLNVVAYDLEVQLEEFRQERAKELFRLHNTKIGFLERSTIYEYNSENKGKPLSFFYEWTAENDIYYRASTIPDKLKKLRMIIDLCNASPSLSANTYVELDETEYAFISHEIQKTDRRKNP